MVSRRSRLLFLLVLLSVVATVGWKSAFAGGDSGPTTVSLSPGAKPPAAPTSGEPDVGQTPRPNPTQGVLTQAPHDVDEIPQDVPADVWVRWICRMLEMQFLGGR
jgi:hypothetical protein